LADPKPVGKPEEDEPERSSVDQGLPGTVRGLPNNWSDE